MNIFIVIANGLLFGLGLIVSGMANPAKVLGFLDIFGRWDASLAFVMGGAVVVTAIGFRTIFKAQKPLYAGQFSIPSRTDIDLPLVGGATLFGVGWALVGLCPGPAIAAMTAAPESTGVFVISMLIGMYLPTISKGRIPFLTAQESV